MFKLLVSLIFSIIPISSCLVAAPSKEITNPKTKISDHTVKDSKPTPSQETQQVQQSQQPQQNQGQPGASMTTLAEKNLKESRSFFEENKKKPGVITLPSGLQYQILKEGTGQPAGPSDFVSVHYRGTLLNQQEFDSSYKSKHPATFAVNAVIPGWTEALQLMKPGAKWMIYVPPQLAYGEKGVGTLIQPNSALIFEVELISVKPALDEVKDGVVEDWEGLD